TGFGALGFDRSDTVTYAGTIQGSGGVTQDGTGTTILTGDNLYSGGTTISAGTLQLGAGGASGSIVGDVANSGTLAFNRNNSYTFDGAITGTGTIAQIGTGTTVLTAGANSADATTVSAGTLQVNGGLTTSTVAMTGTSVLAVNGTIQAAGGTASAITGDAGANRINVNAGATLAAAGDLGGGSDTLTLAGTLNTGAGQLSLGGGNDTFVLNDPAVLTGGVAGGAGTDALQVNNAADRTLTATQVSGFETLNKTLGGILSLTGAHDFSAGTTVQAGVLGLGDGTTGGSVAGDILNNAQVSFNSPGTQTYAGRITGTGSVVKNGTGTTVLTGDNAYSGITDVFAGALIVNGDQSGAMGTTVVNAFATLGGSGVIGGDVRVGGPGRLSPGDPGNVPDTLTINGNLSLGSLTNVDFDFGQANVPGGDFNDLLVVGGDLVLDGTLNVTQSPGGTFGPGVYRIISYGGALTDNGLNAGSPDHLVQTSVAGQVNLINSAGLALSFWDGDAGARANGLVDGGSGTWRAAGDQNWTDETGAFAAPFANASFAVFQGDAGTVNVDNANGQVEAVGMQFAANGYVVQGGDLVLVDDSSQAGLQSFIRVGDGTVAAAGYTATIASNLSGATQLVKSDAGTLVLTGANTYDSGTTIAGGTLQIGSGGTTGSIVGDVVNNGVLAFNRSDAITFAGLISGAGGLTKLGGNTLTLTADNSYAGTTTISAGALQVGDGGTTGAIVGDVVNNGTLTFNRSGALTYAGAITGTGALNVQGGLTLTMTGDSSYDGITSIGGGELRVGAGATVESGRVLIGDGANGVLTIEGGGVLRAGAADVVVGQVGPPVSATLNVTGAGSLLETTGALNIPATSSATGAVNVTGGAEIRTGSTRLGTISAMMPAAPSLTVSGAGSRWTGTPFTMHVGNTSILDGATGSVTTATIGQANAPLALAFPANLTIDGAGSDLSVAGAMRVGLGAAQAFITLSNGGRLGVGGTFALAVGAAGTGVINIGGVEGQAAAGAGVLDAPTLAFGPGTGRVNFNHTSTGYVFATAMSGLGTINQVSGVTSLTGNSAAFTGATNVAGGTLLVNGTLGGATSGPTSVESGATLGGIGVIGGNVAVADGGTLAPGDATGPGTLTINGNLSLAGAVTLDYEFGASNVVGGPLNDLTEVGGHLVLDGAIDVTVTSGGDFGVGVYRVISYGGVLSGPGLAVGDVPADADVSVQTSVAGQVNLVNTAGLTLNFWDGAAGPKGSQVNGGDGTWQNDAGNDNWADVSGVFNGSFNDGEFAIFSAAAGRVAVDDSLGAVVVSGMQFVSDGYVITGDGLTLTGPDSIVNVGDGTAEGAGYSATIESALAGDTRLVKTGLGTLILSGANGYSGGTLIDVGTLSISSDENLGDADGMIAFTGGRLASTADLSTARAVELIGAGTFLPDAGTTLTLAGTVSGPGGFTKDGAGTLVLTAANSYDGDTIVAAGSLFVNGDQSGARGPTSVGAGAILGGTGTIGGDVVLAAGATLAPGALGVGTLTIAGGLSLGATSLLDFQLGDANVVGGALNDLVEVGGNLVLDGTLDVAMTPGGSFGPGIYRLFNYGGALTDNGLELGSLPTGSSVSVQTAVDGQVNLVNTAGLSLTFWDGGVGPKNNDLVDGGSGTWRLGGGSSNWTDSAGAVNADYSQSSFAIFSAA
ncbi:autotransporter-associated beta strand repeat-containing protein, partial [Sphingosinicella sp. CPCC 101087]|uniref:beta strand repeat-containing protein n=1 Tax=Sphingosinicella sp. CPCC 101087 TaxID=2497754 RepID=UPI001981D9C6